MPAGSRLVVVVSQIENRVQEAVGMSVVWMIIGYGIMTFTFIENRLFWKSDFIEGLTVGVAVTFACFGCTRWLLFRRAVKLVKDVADEKKNVYSELYSEPAWHYIKAIAATEDDEVMEAVNPNIVRAGLEHIAREQVAAHERESLDAVVFWRQALRVQSQYQQVGNQGALFKLDLKDPLGK